MIPVFKPYYDQREIDAVTEVIKSGWTGLGPKTAEFEKKFEEMYCTGLHVVGLNSCTAALDLALKLIGVTKGAYEPYALEKYSEPNRYQLGVLLNDLIS